MIDPARLAALAAVSDPGSPKPGRRPRPASPARGPGPALPQIRSAAPRARQRAGLRDVLAAVLPNPGLWAPAR